MEFGDKIWLGFSGMFAFAGTLFLIIGWSHWQSTYRIVSTGVQTQGVVVENVHKPRRGLERQTTSLAPVVQFFTATGEQKLYYSQTYTTPVSHQVGETVTLWYLPDDPNQATLNGVDAWVFPVVFGIFGVAAALIGYPTLLKFLFRQIFSNT